LRTDRKKGKKVRLLGERSKDKRKQRLGRPPTSLKEKGFQITDGVGNEENTMTTGQGKGTREQKGPDCRSGPQEQGNRKKRKKKLSGLEKEGHFGELQ